MRFFCFRKAIVFKTLDKYINRNVYLDRIQIVTFFKKFLMYF